MDEAKKNSSQRLNPILRNYDYNGNYLDRIKSRLKRKQRKKNLSKISQSIDPSDKKEDILPLPEYREPSYDKLSVDEVAKELSEILNSLDNPTRYGHLLKFISGLPEAQAKEIFSKISNIPAGPAVWFFLVQLVREHVEYLFNFLSPKIKSGLFSKIINDLKTTVYFAQNFIYPNIITILDLREKYDLHHFFQVAINKYSGYYDLMTNIVSSRLFQELIADEKTPNKKNLIGPLIKYFYINSETPSTQFIQEAIAFLKEDIFKNKNFESVRQYLKRKFYLLDPEANNVFRKILDSFGALDINFVEELIDVPNTYKFLKVKDVEDILKFSLSEYIILFSNNIFSKLTEPLPGYILDRWFGQIAVMYPKVYFTRVAGIDGDKTWYEIKPELKTEAISEFIRHEPSSDREYLSEILGFDLKSLSSEEEEEILSKCINNSLTIIVRANLKSYLANLLAKFPEYFKRISLAYLLTSSGLSIFENYSETIFYYLDNQPKFMSGFIKSPLTINGIYGLVTNYPAVFKKLISYELIREAFFRFIKKNFDGFSLNILIYIKNISPEFSKYLNKEANTDISIFNKFPLEYQEALKVYPKLENNLEEVKNQIEGPLPENIKFTNCTERDQRPKNFRELKRFILSENNLRPNEILYEIGCNHIAAGDGVQHTDIGVSGFTNSWAVISLVPGEWFFAIDSIDLKHGLIQNKEYLGLDHNKKYIVIEQYQSDYPVVLKNLNTSKNMKADLINNLTVGRIDEKTEENEKNKITAEILAEMNDSKKHLEYISIAYPYLVLRDTALAAKAMGTNMFFMLQDPEDADIKNKKKLRHLYNNIPGGLGGYYVLISAYKDDIAWAFNINEKFFANIDYELHKIKEELGLPEDYNFSLTPAQNNIKPEEKVEKAVEHKNILESKSTEEFKILLEEVKKLLPELEVPNLQNSKQLLSFLNSDVKNKVIGHKEFNRRFSNIIKQLVLISRAEFRAKRLIKLSSIRRKHKYLGDSLGL